MAKKTDEKNDAQVVQDEGNIQTAPDAGTPEVASPAANEIGKAAEASQEDAGNATGEPDDALPQPALESLSVLADRHRVTSWQQAALMRCMGWENGKLVTDEEYRAALIRIKNRPMGGGRLA